MLKAIIDLPDDKKIAGVHCIPITKNGAIVMAWDKEEQLLTTISGRIEESESIVEALEREAMEEVGMTLHSKRIPFASWYWDATDTYTVWFLVKAEKFLPYTFDFEKSGYVITNFETAKQIILKVESENVVRLQILDIAKERAIQLKWLI
ncbi:NUDIX domain-containing protein [Psychrobacillus sp.]|uniref:NUDIX hydrolase n=1 Tax=Psychrobacillus sp. TaxID=1871623 RepID=UPI0028BE923E|nr:NUDIX domain-containing protein [Psychrobacillus sp.]